RSQGARRSMDGGVIQMFMSASASARRMISRITSAGVISLRRYMSFSFRTVNRFSDGTVSRSGGTSGRIASRMGKNLLVQRSGGMAGFAFLRPHVPQFDGQFQLQHVVAGFRVDAEQFQGPFHPVVDRIVMGEELRRSFFC